MGIEEDVKDIRASLLAIKETLYLTYGIGIVNSEIKKEKAPENMSEEKDNVSDKKDKDTKKPETKKEIDSDEPILYTCTNCGVSFAKGEEHNCKMG